MARKVAGKTDVWIDLVVTARVWESRPDPVAILLKRPLSKRLSRAHNRHEMELSYHQQIDVSLDEKSCIVEPRIKREGGGIFFVIHALESSIAA